MPFAARVTQLLGVRYYGRGRRSEAAREAVEAGVSAVRWVGQGLTQPGHRSGKELSSRPRRLAPRLFGPANDARSFPDASQGFYDD